jgi:hypothetical protein
MPLLLTSAERSIIFSAFRLRRINVHAFSIENFELFPFPQYADLVRRSKPLMLILNCLLHQSWAENIPVSLDQ